MFCLQAVEGVVMLPVDEDLSQIGVKSKDMHFITAGSKGLSLELSLTCCHVESRFCGKAVPQSFASNVSYTHLISLPLTAGELRVWEASTARCVYAQTLGSSLSASSEEEDKEDDPRGLTHLLHLPASSRLATVTAEHNIVLYQLPALSTQQQVGTEGEMEFFTLLIVLELERQTADFIHPDSFIII